MKSLLILAVLATTLMAATAYASDTGVRESQPRKAYVLQVGERLTSESKIPKTSEYSNSLASLIYTGSTVRNGVNNAAEFHVSLDGEDYDLSVYPGGRFNVAGVLYQFDGFSTTYPDFSVEVLRVK